MGIGRLTLNISWPKTQCIICLKASVSTEHLIPEALGGRLTSDLLCSSCNSQFGHAIEARAKHDPSIIIAVTKLATQIPEIAKSILESHPHVGHDESGTHSGYMTDGIFTIKRKQLDDGSLLLPIQNAPDVITAILQRAGYGPIPIQNAIDAFDQAPGGIPTEISPGLNIKKWSTVRVEPDLSNATFLDPLVPAKIAFEFLACHAGRGMYADVPQLAKIRHGFQTLSLSPDVLKVERLYAEKYEPFHGICFEENAPYAKVQVRLFGFLAFRVHFLRLAVPGPRCIYTHYLDDHEESLRTLDD